MERSILVAHGYRVEIAISGEDALEKVAGVRFDLVITDIEMPGINGFELTKRLRSLEAYQEVPVIVVSSLSRDEDKRRAIEAGAQAYIVKGSFDQGTLLETVEALIG
jgi:two-component system chemotaxis sensor kinase CheA